MPTPYPSLLPARDPDALDVFEAELLAYPARHLPELPVAVKFELQVPGIPIRVHIMTSRLSGQPADLAPAVLAPAVLAKNLAGALAANPSRTTGGSTGRGADRACGRALHFDRAVPFNRAVPFDRVVLFDGDELLAIAIGAESERLGPAEFKGYCLLKLQDPGFRVTAAVAMAGAEGLVEAARPARPIRSIQQTGHTAQGAGRAWSLARLLSALHTQLVEADLLGSSGARPPRSLPLDAYGPDHSGDGVDGCDRVDGGEPAMGTADVSDIAAA